MSTEAPQEPRPLQPNEVSHTRSKEYVLARGVNVKVDQYRQQGGYGTSTGFAESLLRHPTASTMDAGRDDIIREQRKLYLHHPEKLSRRQRVLFRIGDKLESKGFFNLVDDLLAPRPTYDDKRSYWGRGPYRHMTDAQRQAYRRSRGYDRI